MLKVIPETWSYSFSVVDGTDTVAQAVNLSWWSDKGEIRIGDATYSACRERSSYLLENSDGVVARARQPSRFSSRLVIEHSGPGFELRAKSVMSNVLLVFEGATQIGSVSPDGIFTRTATVDLPHVWPLYLKVFVVWLAMTGWKHAASGGGM